MLDNNEIKSNVTNLELYSDNYPFSLPLKIKSFIDDTHFKKFIKQCEGLVRKSPEYADWRRYLIDVMGINICSLTSESLSEVSLDIHHHIPSLYLIIKAIINKFLSEEKEFSSFDIAYETIKIHYLNNVGYVCLLKSLHEKFHNGFLMISIENIKGNYKKFLDEYKNFLDEEDMININDRLSIHSSNNNWNKNTYIQGQTV